MSIKYTNKFNLSKPIADWLQFDEYDREEDTISTTTLLKSPRQFHLEKRHRDKLEIDISDLVASRFGTAIHNSFELAFTGNTNYQQEERHYKDIDIYGNTFRLSGKFDFIVDNMIHDIKTTSVWTYMFDSNKDKYIQQLSIYKYLLNGKIALKDTCKIVYVFTDWSKAKTLQDKQYPRTRVLEKEYKLMSIEETESFIKERLMKIVVNQDKSDTELDYCTQEELWQDKDKFAVYSKAKNKKATKSFDNLEDAMKFQREKGYEKVEHRKGGVQACNYCNVRNFCNQYIILEQQGLIK